ncbi:short chain dehydrogenase [Clostridium fallax]|uniref:Short-chain dehydrogenase n=1 Tax=Clostridium fallax TaxID=1533 RepID=A0A1M4T5M0_9CLOT|nr:hypothetical protein SAMN05443638_10232 [Clostridium fallax]SQB22611.1 short chain dehydrogenase [Clostridium fallax]
MEITLITGATSGIGYELAKLFARDGNNLLLIGRNKNKMKEIKESLEENYKINVFTLIKDLKKEQSGEEIYNYVEKNNLIVDNLINNAGFGSFGCFNDIDRIWDLDMIKVNIFALTNLTKLFLPNMMKRNKGGILNVASTAAFQGGPLMAVYYGTKAYVLSISEALAEELVNTNIKVSVLCPGPVDTSFQSVAKVKKSSFAKGYMMEAKFVAKKGYDGFRKGKTIIIPGFKNKLLIQGLRILPRKLVSKVIKRVNNG